MLLQYLITNFMTVVLVFSLVVIMYVYRDMKLPFTKTFIVAIPLLLIFSFSDHFHSWAMVDLDFTHISRESALYFTRVRRICSIIGYIILPLLILVELYPLIESPSLRHLSLLPAVINTIIYATSPLFGDLVFTISEQNLFVRGPLGLSVYVIAGIYIACIFIYALKFFWAKRPEQGLILVYSLLAIIAASILEYENLLSGFIDETAALSLLLYYTHIIAVNQKKMQDRLLENDLKRTQQQLSILQEQISPHFIFNSLGQIRSLIKKDPQRAITHIDSFAAYLRDHVNALKSNEPIPFQSELNHTLAYLALALADYGNLIKTEFELTYTDFVVPPLTLEPIVENAVKHGVGRDPVTITIGTRKEGAFIIIYVKDTGLGTNGSTQKEQMRLGVGLDNTATRLKIVCGGTLTRDTTPEGTTVIIRIPMTKQSELKKDNPYLPAH